MARSQSGPRAAGLPSTPRTVSTGRRAREEPDSYSPSQYNTSLPSRQVRPQKSTVSIPRGRSRPRQPQPTDKSQLYYERPEPTSHRKSNESTSSSGSSLLDQIKGGAGYASSRTSFEDDEQMHSSKWQPDVRSRSLREEPTSSQEYEIKSASGTGDGYTIWSRVATVASTMTVSVGKAWATNIKTFAGEETPPGQESRLTRAMKAYHLEKARDPTDLPTWLFDEHERRPPPGRPRAGTRRDADDYDAVEATFTERPRPGGLRDIYEAAAATSSTPPVKQDRPIVRSYADDGVQPSKATDRLKAMRDAKRSALSSNSAPNHQAGEPRGGDLRGEINGGRGRSAQTDLRPVRVGLPSGPTGTGRTRRL